MHFNLSVFLILFVILKVEYCQTRPFTLNAIAEPKSTKISFSFKKPIIRPVRLEISQMGILSLLTFDTLLEAGTSEFSIVLKVEAPIYLPIEIDTFVDHVFLIPGEGIELEYDDPLSTNHKTSSPIHTRIESYYQGKYDMLGVHKVVQEAYQFTRDYPNLQKGAAILDSMSVAQRSLLTEQSGRLPRWFIEYEHANIEHTGLTYKMALGKNLVYHKYIDRKNEFLQGLPLRVEQIKEENMIVPFYLNNLRSSASITYCEEGCFEEPAHEARIAGYLALLRYFKKIDNKEIKGCLSFRTLMEIQRSSGQVSDTITNKLEIYLQESSYLNKYMKYNTRDLTGEKAPNFYLRDRDSLFHSLNQFRDSTVLLYFWFVGCRPCQAEIPHAKRIVSKFFDERIRFISVCLKSNEAAWRNKIQAEDLPGINLYANANWSKKITREYNISPYPRYVLVDRYGTIVSDNAPRPSNPELEITIRSHLESYGKRGEK